MKRIYIKDKKTYKVKYSENFMCYVVKVYINEFDELPISIPEGFLDKETLYLNKEEFGELFYRNELS